MADEDSIPSPKAGPSKEPTRQVHKGRNRKKRGIFRPARYILMTIFIVPMYFVNIILYYINKFV